MRKRIRELIEIPGRFSPGSKNSITDVKGVKVGHKTIHDNEKCIHTGITIISPHDKDIYMNKVPGAILSGNGFGKLAGSMQVNELGEIESLIGLTNTFSVAQVIQGLLNIQAPKVSEDFPSINVLVGETNDSYLSDIKGFHIKPEHVLDAIDDLSENVVEGSVGAGAGTICYGFKGGIGTSSRVVPKETTGEDRDYTVGAILQTNFGENLNVYGAQLPYKPLPNREPKGSCMIVVATDAPLLDRQLLRLAKRALVGITNTGSFLGHYSGDFVVAFSNYEKNLRNPEKAYLREIDVLSDEQLNPFFEAIIEAVSESVYNSLTMATEICGIDGHIGEELDITKYGLNLIWK